MKYTCSQGQTWDSVAFVALKDEFMFPYILEVNRKYADVVEFNGGEEIEIPDEIVLDDILVTRPFQSGSSVGIIQAPWE